MADLDGDAIIAKYCGFLGDRVRYDADLSNTVLADLSCAVVIVNAFWSGPSMQTLVRIARTIGDADPDGCIELIVSTLTISLTLRLIRGCFTRSEASARLRGFSTVALSRDVIRGVTLISA